MFKSIALLTCLAATFAVAEMKLTVSPIDVKPKPEDETITVSFTFKNEGTKPVKVLSLESTCSCLSSSMDKAVYEPGEMGTGKAEFKISSFVGKHEKSVMVTTDDPEQPEWNIPFILDVPAVVEITPNNVQWWLNEEATAKDITVKMTGADPMKLTKITATRENVEFSFKEITPGREYRVTVKPKQTLDVMIGALKLETDSKIPKYQRQLAFFSVVRQPASRVGEAKAGAVSPAPALNSNLASPAPSSVAKP